MATICQGLSPWIGRGGTGKRRDGMDSPPQLYTQYVRWRLVGAAREGVQWPAAERRVAQVGQGRGWPVTWVGRVWHVPGCPLGRAGSESACSGLSPQLYTQ